MAFRTPVPRLFTTYINNKAHNLRGHNISRAPSPSPARRGVLLFAGDIGTDDGYTVSAFLASAECGYARRKWYWAGVHCKFCAELKYDGYCSIVQGTHAARNVVQKPGTMIQSDDQ